MTEEFVFDEGFHKQRFMNIMYYATEYFKEREGRLPSDEELWQEMQKFE